MNFPPYDANSLVRLLDNDRLFKYDSWLCTGRDRLSLRCTSQRLFVRSAEIAQLLLGSNFIRLRSGVSGPDELRLWRCRLYRVRMQEATALRDTKRR